MNTNEQDYYKIQREARDSGDWEPLRRYYLPDTINFLLIGHAPPEGGERYFYYDDVPQADNLFLNVMEALFPREASVYRTYKTPEGKRRLLEKFRSEGCYLMELYPVPIKKKKPGCGESFYARDFFERLSEIADRIKFAEDLEIIIVHESASVLQTMFSQAGFKVHRLKFPLYGNQAEFKAGLKEIVDRFKQNHSE